MNSMLPPNDFFSSEPNGKSDKTTLPAGLPETIFRPAKQASPKTKVAGSAGREYISGAPDVRLGSYLKALPLYIDDITRDLGDDIYERMQYDSQVFSCLEIYKLATLDVGWSMQPAFGEKDDVADIHKQRSQKVLKFCDRVVKQMEQPIDRTLYELLAGAALGSKLCEVTYEDVDDIFDNKPRVHIKSIKAKNRRCITYVVDAFNNILGVLANIPGAVFPVYRGSIFQDVDELPNMVPREKCIIYTHNPHDNDPQGRSVLRPVYDPWWHKLQAKAEFIRCMALYSVPSVYGTVGEKAQSSSDGLTPEENLLSALQRLRSGSAAAFPYGTIVQTLNVPASIGIFIQALDWYDRQIAKGILSQTLATEEGEHQARAAAETHRDIMDTILLNPRKLLGTTIRNDLLRVLVRLNFGKTWARYYTPFFTVGSSAPREDATQISSAIASLIGSGFLAPNQYAFFEEKLGLPPGDRKKAGGPPQQQQPQQQQPPQGGGDEKEEEGDDQTPPSPEGKEKWSLESMLGKIPGQ